MRAYPVSFLAIALFVLVSCGFDTVETGRDPIATIASPIVNGSESDNSQDGVVLVMHFDPQGTDGNVATDCTGSLLTPRLVLTARHCVSVTDSDAACSSQGAAIAGGAVIRDYDPAHMFVFGGQTRPDFHSEGALNASKGQEILTTNARTICNNDLALILLDHPVDGGKISPIRLDDGTPKGETVTLVGWGITGDGPNPPATRRQRTGVRILDVGPAVALGPAEFSTGEGACEGDSGGPAIAASGAVLGALSRGGNGSSDSCLGATNVFSSLAGHADFIRQAYAKAGQDPWLEGDPNPLLAKFGQACAVDVNCQSTLCDPDRKVCSQSCPETTCPAAFVCGDKNGRKQCVPRPIHRSGGCAASRRQANDRESVKRALPLLFVVVLFARKRRKISVDSTRR